jgi:aromatic ring-cleaving dioxygenase
MQIPNTTRQANAGQAAFAKALWERIRRECTCCNPASRFLPSYQPTVPELRIYRFWDRPIGPHPVAMFEVNLFTPAQFGAFIPWLVINRGPLSALVHPNTDGEGEDKRNHTQRATWLGERLPLDLSLFK